MESNRRKIKKQVSLEDPQDLEAAFRSAKKRESVLSKEFPVPSTPKSSDSKPVRDDKQSSDPSLSDTVINAIRSELANRQDKKTDQKSGERSFKRHRSNWENNHLQLLQEAWSSHQELLQAPEEGQR